MSASAKPPPKAQRSGNGSIRTSKAARQGTANASALAAVGSSHKHGRTKAASASALGLAKEVIASGKNPLSPQYVTDLARAVVELVMRSGNLATVLEVWERVKQRPEMVGLQIVQESLAAIDPTSDSFGSDTPGMKERFLSQSLQVQVLVIESMQEFVNEQLRNPTTGRFNANNRHIAASLIAATFPKDKPHLYAEYCRKMRIGRDLLQRGKRLYEQHLQDSSRNWKLVPPREARSTAYTEAADLYVYDHLLDISFPNNENKNLVRKSLGVINGVQQYALVEKRIMHYTKAEVLEMFYTSPYFEPWMTEARKSQKSPKCSINVLSKVWGWHGEFTSYTGTIVCVCPHCVLIDRNQPPMGRAMALRCPKTCDRCGGKCGTQSRQHNIYKGQSSMMAALLCPKEHFAHLDIPVFNPENGNIDWLGPRLRCELYHDECATGNCDECGFERLFPDAASRKKIGTDGNESIVYGCPGMDLAGDSRQDLFAFQKTPDGTQEDPKTGKIRNKTRTDWVSLNLSVGRAVADYQRYCREYAKHMVPVKLRSHMQKHQEFWFDTARGLYHSKVDALIHWLAGMLSDFLVEEAVEIIAGNADPSAGYNFPPTFTPPAAQPIIQPMHHQGCYRFDCPYRAGTATSMTGPRCYSPACAAAQSAAIPVPPDTAFGRLKFFTDYAADAAIDTGVERTCAHPRGIKNGVWVTQHSPFLQWTSEMENGNSKESRVEAGILAQLERYTDVMFALSSSPHDKVATTNTQRDIAYFYQHGMLPKGTSGCMWIDGKRVKGSVDFSDPANQAENEYDFYPSDEQTGGELPYHDGPYHVVDGEDCRQQPPTQNLSKDFLALDGIEVPTGGRIKLADVTCDNAAGTYANSDRHFAIQQSGDADHGGLRVREERSLANHGKMIADRENKSVPAHIKKQARLQKPVTSSAYALALSYARHNSKRTDAWTGARKPMPKRRWNNARLRAVLYYPYASFDQKLGNNSGNKIPLSKQYHLFQPLGEGDGLRLGFWDQLCSCRPCSNGNHRGCLSQKIIPPGKSMVMLPRTAPAVTRGGDRLDAFNEYLLGLKVNTNVVVRINEGKDPQAPCETFFIAKITQKPWTLQANERVAGIVQKKGYQIVAFNWYEYERTDGNGDFLYRLDDHHPEVEYPATAVVSTATKYVANFRYDAGKLLYRMPRADVEKIERYCDLSSK